MARLNVQDLKIDSPDFAPGGSMDPRFCADGGSTLPRLRITGVPKKAVELAVVCHDPDAPLAQGFTHLTLYGVPPTVSEIGPENVGEFRQGPNDAGRTGYYGPQPPAGHGVHHYYFWVYALDTPVDGTPTRGDFLERYADHIIEQNRVIGTFES
jgi:Raf kinase inhibitor-like YbhB/YbcL family protein